MERVMEGWNIVILGRWNASIFSPDWVSKYVFDEQEVEAQVQIEFPLVQMPALRYDKGAVTLTLHGQRLVVQPRSHDVADLREAEQRILRIVDILPYTPMHAIGMNFRYLEPNPSPALEEMFAFSDEVPINGREYSIGSREIKRQLRKGAEIMNLAMSLTDGTVTFDVNYHSAVNTRDEVFAAIDGKMQELSAASCQFLTELYPSREEDS